jgi:carboxymethylenebutenolidase
MNGESLTITTRDGPFQAYVARPATPGRAPAVVVIQEIFGVNAVMRLTAERLAVEGYLAVAPDLFWRIEPGVDITDKTKAEWDKAFSLMNAFDPDLGVEDIQATLDAARQDSGCSGKAGAVGYCLGGRLAYLTATRTDVDASVGYYGVGIENHLAEAEKLASPLMLHVAEEDQFVSKAAQARIVDALSNHPAAEIFSYPGRDHAFAREGGAHYDAEDAGKANARTLELFARTLR